MTSRNGGKRDRQNQFFRATAMSPIGTIEPDSVIESGSFSMNKLLTTSLKDKLKKTAMFEKLKKTAMFEKLKKTAMFENWQNETDLLLANIRRAR
jgi:hypothetical protein